MDDEEKDKLDQQIAKQQVEQQAVKIENTEKEQVEESLESVELKKDISEVELPDLALESKLKEIELRELDIQKLEQQLEEIKSKIAILEQKKTGLKIVEDNLPELVGLEKQLTIVNNSLEIHREDLTLAKIEAIQLQEPEFKIDLEKTELSLEKPLGEIVEIEDKYLAEHLDRLLTNSNNRDPRSRINGYRKFTKEELETIRELRLTDSRIENINQLDYCTNLRSLEIISNSREKVASDLGLPQKFRQMVDSSKIKDFSVIGRLKDLQLLKIGFQRYLGELDIAPLKHLRTLELYYNTNLTDLKGLTDAKELAILVSERNPQVQPFDLPTMLLEGNLEKVKLDFEVYTRIKNSLPLMEQKIVEEKFEKGLQDSKATTQLEQDVQLSDSDQYVRTDQDFMVEIMRSESLSDEQKVASVVIYGLEGQIVNAEEVERAKQRIADILEEEKRKEDEKQKKEQEAEKEAKKEEQQEIKEEQEQEDSYERGERLPDLPDDEEDDDE